MSNTIYRVMGKRGRITIPYEFRQQVGFCCNDLLSFTKQDDNTVIIRRESSFGYPTDNHAADTGVTLRDLLDSLTPTQQKAALVHLSIRWAEQHGKTPKGRSDR